MSSVYTAFLEVLGPSSSDQWSLLPQACFHFPAHMLFLALSTSFFFLVRVFGFRADIFVIAFSCKIWKSSIPLFLCACAVLFRKKSILKNEISSLGVVFICTLVISRAERKDQ